MCVHANVDWEIFIVNKLSLLPRKLDPHLSLQMYLLEVDKDNNNNISYYVSCNKGSVYTGTHLKLPLEQTIKLKGKNE